MKQEHVCAVDTFLIYGCYTQRTEFNSQLYRQLLFEDDYLPPFFLSLSLTIQLWDISERAHTPVPEDKDEQKSLLGMLSH